MPRTTAPSVPVADLPEFMRSRTVAAIVAEVLDHHAINQASNSDATRSLITGAAGELRSFHGLPGASADPQGIEPAPWAERQNGSGLSDVEQAERERAAAEGG